MELCYEHKEELKKYNLLVYSYVVKLSDKLFSGSVVVDKDGEHVDVSFTARKEKDLTNSIINLANWTKHHYSYKK